MDYTKLRAQAMSSGQDEEAVTVNTRALIDKVLARYSGENTTLRELIQNAADASATTVKIKFETIPSAQVPVSNVTSDSEVLKHVLLHHTLRRLLVTNDGVPFNANDWSRLKRIAEGNPDETKIGAFGVGFYSVFADCEEPFVSSGNEAMTFYWKGNSLFTRKLQLSESNKETSFVLDYRNSTSPVPALLPLCQFLATSLTFVALQNIELWLDDWKILSLQKKAAPSVEYPIPRDVETKTKEGLMKLHSLERESVQMDAAFMNIVGWKPSSTTIVPKSSSFGENNYGHNLEAPSLRSFFSRLTATSSHANLKGRALREENAMQEIALEDLTAPTTSNVFLSVTTGTIRTSVSASFASELERATKKPPPKTTKLAILTSSYDETSASSQGSNKAETATKRINVFASVLPGKNPGGRIFIGFPTHQTTGAGIHLSAPSVIPTVERESIDLNARWVRTWNIEMLRVAGIITRLAFTREMADLGSKVKRAAESAGRGAKISKDDIDNLLPEAEHILQTFTFSESTPSSQVAQIIEEAFWTTYKTPSIEIYSTRGVLPTTSVRIATEDFSGFVEGIPVIPKLLDDNKFIKKLVDFGLVTEITVGDVKTELGAKALTKDQLIHFIGWAGKKAITGEIDAATINDLLDNAIATVHENENQGEIVALSTIKYYRNPNKIPPEMPVPANTISFELTRLSSANELQALGWEPLEIVPWLRFLVGSIGGRNGLSTDQDITWSPRFSGQVLAIISKQWESLSQSSKGTVLDLLKPLSCIPTKLGMKIPTEAYFPNVKLFDDLPTVTGFPGVKEKLLAALGVRKTVELDAIFARLLSPSEYSVSGEKSESKWSHVDLIKYLASVRDDIPPEDLKKLKATPICAAEAGPASQESTQGTSKRYKINELFEPKESLRSLGLPILQWSGKGEYRPGSQEGRFLTSLGLRAFPSVVELVEMMASDDLATRGRAMTYFIANHSLNGYASFNLGGTKTAFLPVQGDEKRLVTPAQCFTNEKSALLGFNVLQQPLVMHANKFGVADNPPMTDCVNRLIAEPPKSHREAVALFGYFATRLGEIGQIHTAKLGDAQIVPVSTRVRSENQSSGIKHIAPRICFIGESGTYRDIFDFVDFSPEANVFLLHCGSKHEPSKSQVASMLATEPARVLGIVQSPDKYLSLLRMLADALPDLKRDKTLFKQMKLSSFLLATRDIPGKPMKENEKVKNGSYDLDDDDEEVGIKQWSLQPANRIVVADDYTTYRIFKEALLCAPLEESLENLYLALGSSLISTLVHDDVRLGNVVERQDITPKLRKRILERSKLLLHEFPADSIRHDSRWLEKNLSVEMVSNISLRRSLKGYTVSHTAKQTATLNHDQRKGWVLWITRDYDMYHVSQALVAQLLSRPNNQSTALFEFLLTSDLQGLKRRGFNVDRILRAQAVDARIAEDERRKQLEAEQKQIREQEELWKQSKMVPAAAGEERRKSGQEVAMPGAFGNDSPENSPMPPQHKKSRGLFSGLTRRLGIDGHEAQQHLQNFFTGNHHDHEEEAALQPNGNTPPSYYDETSHGLKPGVRPPGETEKVTSPAALYQNLLNAIQSSRPHDSSTLFSPPSTTTVKEQASYCDSRSAHNITHAGDAANGMRIFVSRDLTISAADFLSSNAAALNVFATLLYEVGDVYGIPRRALHIFYDEVGSTIAFNAQGSVFCNFRFFQQLHARKVEFSPGEGRVEAASWWWIVVAHELAHNLVNEHSAEHSYYT
jgi:Protein of unknown function (DUF3684)